MVDNRSAGFYGIGGGFNFKSGDASGTAAKTQDDKMGQGGEYFAQGQNGEEEQPKEENFVDRSAQLRGTLDSLAMLNAAGIKKKYSLKKNPDTEEDDQNNATSDPIKPKKSKRELSHLVDDFEKEL